MRGAWDGMVLSGRPENCLTSLPAETMMGTPPPAPELQQPQPQALHYTLANAQQVQIHQIGEDGQVQVVRDFSALGWGSRGALPGGAPVRAMLSRLAVQIGRAFMGLPGPSRPTGLLMSPTYV